jgi:hypothetical protein
MQLTNDVELGDRVEYEDMANPRRAGEVTGITRTKWGTQYQVRWDDDRSYTWTDLRQSGWTHV